MKIYIYLILFVSLFLSFCRKDVINEGSVVRIDSLVMGLDTNVNIKKYNILIEGGYHNLQKKGIDANNDNNPDFELISQIWGSPGAGQHPEPSIQPISPSFYVFGNLIQDSVFVKLGGDTTEYITNNSKVRVRIGESYSCYKVSSLYLFNYISNPVFYIKPFGAGNVLNQDQIKRNEYLKFNTTSFHFNSSFYRNDTLFEKYSTYNYTFIIFPIKLFTLVLKCMKATV